MIKFEEHLKKHCKKENTYDENCPFCNPSIKNKILCPKCKQQMVEIIINKLWVCPNCNERLKK